MEKRKMSFSTAGSDVCANEEYKNCFIAVDDSKPAQRPVCNAAQTKNAGFKHT